MNQINIINRKAKYDYEFIESYNAGIVLFGNEVKSIRNGKCSLSGTFCYIDNGEVFIKNSYIKYENNSHSIYSSNISFDEQRPRKLLLNKKEINKIQKYISQPGYTLVPYRIYNYKGLLKVELKVCKGKHDYDKRETIKERDIKRQLKTIKNANY